MSAPRGDRSQYPDRIEQRRAELWSQVGAQFGPSLRTREALTDWDFAARYLKGSAFPLAGPSRWFEPAPLHHDLSQCADEHTRLLIQLPREFAKSSLFSLIRPLRLICAQPNIRILLVSKTEEAAARFTGAIKHQLESNPRLLQDFGPFVGSLWTERKFTVVREQAFKEPTLQAVGRGGQIVSGRYDLVVLDDVEDYDATRTEAGRLKTYEWLMQDVVPVVVSGGRLYVIQTPQHPADLVGQLRERGGIWHFVNIPAEGPRSDRAPGDLERESRWPEKWPIYWTDCAVQAAEVGGAPEDQLGRTAATACVQCPVYSNAEGGAKGIGCLTGKRFEVGTVTYRLQYLVDPAAFSGGHFKPEYWQYYVPAQVRWNSNLQRWIYYELRPDQNPLAFEPHQATAHSVDIVFGVDPAIADENAQAPDATRSRFALVVLGYVPRLRRQLLLHYENRRVDFPTQKRMIVEQYHTWHPRQIGIESVAYQRALGQDLQREHHLPVRPLPVDGDKFRRILMLTPDCEAGHVHLRGEPDPVTGALRSTQREFQTQAEAFPNGALHDLLDAWHYARRLVGRRKMLEGYGTASPGTEPTAQPQGWTGADVIRRSAITYPAGWTSADLRHWARPS